MLPASIQPHHTYLQALLSIVMLCHLQVCECTFGPHILYRMAEDFTNTLTATIKAARFVLY